MRILKIFLFSISILATAPVAQADYYIGQGRCKDGDTIVHVRECRAAGVSGRTDGFAVAVCCKAKDDSGRYTDGEAANYDNGEL